MEIKDLISPSRISFDLKASTKDEVIDELIDLLYADGVLYDREKYKEAVLKREEEFSTAIGLGIAIPHGKDSSVKTPAVAFGISSKGIDCKAIDGTDSNLFFLLAVPNDTDDMYLKVLSTISRRLMHEKVRTDLMSASTYEQLLIAFNA